MNPEDVMSVADFISELQSRVRDAESQLDEARGETVQWVASWNQAADVVMELRTELSYAEKRVGELEEENDDLRELIHRQVEMFDAIQNVLNKH